MNNKGNILDAVDKLFKTKTDHYIFVYKPPKVGSTTLVTSLRISLGRKFNIVHIHDEVMMNVLTGINNVKINDIIKHLSSIGKNVYVIDVYRTPIERKISGFFEKISQHHFNNTEENINKYSVGRVIDRFNKLFPHLENGDHYLDIYNIESPIPFDFNKKYTLQEIDNIKYIKLRLCDSSLWGELLSTLFKTKVVIINEYTTKNKRTGNLYATFLKEYKLPAKFLESVKECKYLNYYYSEEEINKYLTKWGTNVGADVIPYTGDQYGFYMNLCLENQYMNDVQQDHYTDNMCSCKVCDEKRAKIFISAKKGVKTFPRIVHENIKKRIIIVKKHNKFKPNKFKPNQFKINNFT